LAIWFDVASAGPQDEKALNATFILGADQGGVSEGAGTK
jgi:hypothetical protein